MTAGQKRLRPEAWRCAPSARPRETTAMTCVRARSLQLRRPLAEQMRHRRGPPSPKSAARLFFLLNVGSTNLHARSRWAQLVGRRAHAFGWPAQLGSSSPRHLRLDEPSIGLHQARQPPSHRDAAPPARSGQIPSSSSSTTKKRSAPPTRGRLRTGAGHMGGRVISAHARRSGPAGASLTGAYLSEERASKRPRPRETQAARRRPAPRAREHQPQERRRSFPSAS